MTTTRAPRAFVLGLIAAASFFFGIVGMEETFGRLRPRQQPPLLYALEVHNADGDLLASPLLVGNDDGPVHLKLSQAGHVEPEGDGVPGLNMSLDLSPQMASGQALCVAYSISLDAGEEQHGRVALSLGERRSVKLQGQFGEGLRLDLTVARAGSRAFEAILRARRGKPII